MFSEIELTFFDAIKAGKFDVVESVVQKNPSVLRETTEDGGLSLFPIHQACRFGQLEMVKLFLKRAPKSINALNEYAYTPLRYAAVNNHPDIVNHLLDLGADPNIATDTPERETHEYRPIHWAVVCGHREVVQCFLAHDVEINARITDQSLHLIHFAIKSNQLGILQFLLDRYPQWVTLTDKQGRELLHHAAAYGNIDMVIDLILRKVEINIQITNNDSPSFGLTPLHFATIHGHLSVVQCLLSFGADINMRLAYKQRHLIHFAAKEGHAEIVKLLLNIEPDWLNLQDQDGRTPLFMAVHSEHLEVVDLLLSLDVCLSTTVNNPDHPDHGMTALMKAMKEGNYDVANRIILKMHGDTDLKPVLSFIQDGAQAVSMLYLAPRLAPIFLSDPRMERILTEYKSYNPRYRIGLYLPNSTLKRRPSAFIGIDNRTGVPTLFKPVKELGTGGYGEVRLFQNAEGEVITIKKFKYQSREYEPEQLRSLSKKLHREIKCNNLVYPGFHYGASFEFSKINHRQKISFFESRMVMPYLQGSLAPMFFDTLNCPLQLTVVTLKIAQALLRIHRLGIVHGDFHSGNILIHSTEEGEYVVYIIDFGEAHKMKHSSASRWGSKNMGKWFAPELCVESEVLVPPHPSQDVYSFGFLLETLLLGREEYSDIERNFPSIPKFITAAGSSDPKVRPSLESFCDELTYELENSVTLESSVTHSTTIL